MSNTRQELKQLRRQLQTIQRAKQATAARFDIAAWKAATERHLAGELTDSEYLELAIPDPAWRAVVADRLAAVRDL